MTKAIMINILWEKYIYGDISAKTYNKLVKELYEPKAIRLRQEVLEWAELSRADSAQSVQGSQG